MRPKTYIGTALSQEDHDKLHYDIGNVLDGKPVSDVLCVAVTIVVDGLRNMREQLGDVDVGFAWEEFREIVVRHLQPDPAPMLKLAWTAPEGEA